MCGDRQNGLIQRLIQSRRDTLNKGERLHSKYRKLQNYKLGSSKDGT